MTTLAITVIVLALLFDYIAPRFGNKSAAFMRAEGHGGKARKVLWC